MKTLSNNTKLIEQYIFGQLAPVNRLLFETRLLVNRDLRKDLYFQRKTYSIVKGYHRKKVKEDLEKLYQQIFAKPENLSFKQKILELFS